MQRVLKLIGCLVLVILVSSFTQKEFKTYSRDNLDSTDTNIDSILNSYSNPEEVDSLILSHLGLTEIPDITPFSNLKYLDLSFNQIAYVDWYKLLSNETRMFENRSLEYLNLSNNQIDSCAVVLYMDWLPNLKGVNLSYNGLEYFHILGDSLDYLDLSNNQLETIRLRIYSDSLFLANNPLQGEQFVDTLQYSYIDIPSIDPFYQLVNYPKEYHNSRDFELEIQPSDVLQLEYYKKRELTESSDLFLFLSLDDIENINFINGVRDNFEDETVLHSSDHLVKIFKIKQSVCGATCWMRDIHYIHWQENNKENLSKIDILGITKIVKMPDHKYLIFQHAYQRTDYDYNQPFFGVRLISFKDGKIQNHSIPKPKDYSRLGIPEYYLKEDLILTEMEEGHSYLTYTPETKKLSFASRYQTNNDYIDHLEGEYVYINGQFVLIKEKHIKANLTK